MDFGSEYWTGRVSRSRRDHAVLGNVRFAIVYANGKGIATFEVRGLFFAERGANFAHSRGQGDLEIFRHCLLAATDGSLLLRLSDHALYAFDCLLAFLERSRDFLGELLDFSLLALLDGLVVETGQHVLLMQLVKLPGLLSNVGEGFGDLVLDVEPARRQ